MATPLLVNGYTGVLATALPVRNQDCKVMGYHIFNPSNATAFLQFYRGQDNAPSGPTVGTTVADWVVPILTLTHAFLPVTSQADGLFFKGALWMAATTTIGGSTAPSAALVVSLAIT